MYHKFLKMNNYFILDKKDIGLIGLLSYKSDNLRWNLAKTKFVVKTKKNQKIPKALSTFKSYNHNEILQELSKVEWKPIIEI